MNRIDKRLVNPPDCEQHAERLKQAFQKFTPDEARLISQVLCRDPLVGFYPWAMLVCTVCMVFILFWPFDFTGPTNHVQWSTESPGIEFMGHGQVISPSSSKALYDSLVHGQGFAIEAWIQPYSNQHRLLTRIISYSAEPTLHNFTLSQQKANLRIRLRTKRPHLKGAKPLLIVRNVFPQPKPVHLVVSYDFKALKVFVDGSLRVNSPTLGGHFNNWNPNYRLVLGNEATGDRPWSGKIAYVAIYDQVLDAQDVRLHYLNVKNWVTGAGKIPLTSKAPVVQYLLDEKKGSHIANTGTLSSSLSLEIPEKIETAKRPFLAPTPERRIKLDSYAGYEMLFNVFLFIPFAFLLHGLFSSRINGFWKPIFAVIAVGALTTISVEMLQHFSESRYSSQADIVTNLIGVVIGVSIKVYYDALLKQDKALILRYLAKADPSIASPAGPSATDSH